MNSVFEQLKARCVKHEVLWYCWACLIYIYLTRTMTDISPRTRHKSPILLTLTRQYGKTAFPCLRFCLQIIRQYPCSWTQCLIDAWNLLERPIISCLLIAAIRTFWFSKIKSQILKWKLSVLISQVNLCWFCSEVSSHLWQIPKRLLHFGVMSAVKFPANG